MYKYPPLFMMTKNWDQIILMGKNMLMYLYYEYNAAVEKADEISGLR